MRFARIVFVSAGVWGILVLTPLFWLIDFTGRRYAPPTDYPHFFYGFLSVAFAWQIAFLVIGSNPIRFRPMMILGMLEKLGFVATATVLYAQGRIPAADAQAGIPDFLLCILFIVAFAKTRPGIVSAGDGARSMTAGREEAGSDGSGGCRAGVARSRRAGAHRAFDSC